MGTVLLPLPGHSNIQMGGRTGQLEFEFFATDGTQIFLKPVRAGIFVASPFTDGQSSVRSDITGRELGLCRPDGAEIDRFWFAGSTNMPRLTALGMARRRKRHPGRARSLSISEFELNRWRRSAETPLRQIKKPRWLAAFEFVASFAYFTSVRQNLSMRSSPFSMFAILVA
jgi:hypothetical protein